MRYTARVQKRHWPRRLVIILVAATIAVVGATAVVRKTYFEKLKPLSGTTQEAKLITIEKGASADEIAKQLEETGLIRSAWAFKLYVSSKEVRNALQAGTYSLDASMSVSQIVSQLTHGKVATNLVTILPGQRIDQIRTALISYGFPEQDVDDALDPESHLAHPALVDKPEKANLEGYIYPDSYEKTGSTTPHQIISQALGEMHEKVTPALRDDFAAQGLSTYQAITVASIVEKEVSSQSDRNQAAQVFIKRFKIGMPLGADPTALYGAIAAGRKPSLSFDSPYNTLKHAGLPPTPISNVTVSSMNAVAHPAQTDWLYFVSGDDGVTHFTRTLEEHEAATRQYCQRLCSQP